MKNIEVIECFLKKDWGNSDHLHSTGDKLISYNTCIAQWNNDKIILNTTKYSVTSSIHLGLLKSRLEGCAFYVEKRVNNIPINCRDLNGRQS